MNRAYRIVNVFSVDGASYTGNPLCVFEDVRGLDAAELQALARQLNLSETTFVLPSARADAAVRIFTPAFELPFAGHPVLGTAAVVAGERGRVVLETAAGLVPVEREGTRWRLRAAKAPAVRPAAVPRAALAAALGLTADAVAGEPRWVDTGVEQLVVPLATPRLVRLARPTPGLAALLAPEARAAVMVYPWARGERAGLEWTARMFFPGPGGALLEDPATGSACANLGGYLLSTGEGTPLEAAIRQGDAVGRPSRLHLRVAADGAIFVAGEVVEFARGVASAGR